MVCIFRCVWRWCLRSLSRSGFCCTNSSTCTRSKVHLASRLSLLRHTLPQITLVLLTVSVLTFNGIKPMPALTGNHNVKVIVGYWHILYTAYVKGAMLSLIRCESFVQLRSRHVDLFRRNVDSNDFCSSVPQEFQCDSTWPTTDV